MRGLTLPDTNMSGCDTHVGTKDKNENVRGNTAIISQMPINHKTKYQFVLYSYNRTAGNSKYNDSPSTQESTSQNGREKMPKMEKEK